MSDYRLRRGPVLSLLLLVGIIGLLVIARAAVRPQADVLGLVTVPNAYTGTSYAFDEVVCLRATDVGARVTGVSSGRSGPVSTRLLLRPAGAIPAFAFPVRHDAGGPVAGLRIAAHDQRCLRVLVGSTTTGEHRAGRVSVRLSYGPFGILRAGLNLTPNVLLQVTSTGTDPRGVA